MSSSNTSSPTGEAPPVTYYSQEPAAAENSYADAPPLPAPTSVRDPLSWTTRADR